MLWALASMGERAGRELLQAMQKRAAATAGELNPQNVANVLWALVDPSFRALPGCQYFAVRRRKFNKDCFSWGAGDNGGKEVSGTDGCLAEAGDGNGGGVQASGRCKRDAGVPR